LFDNYSLTFYNLRYILVILTGRQMLQSFAGEPTAGLAMTMNMAEI